MHIAFYQSSPQHLYGGQLDLLRYLAACDRGRVSPVVVCPAEGPFVQRCEAMGVPVTVLPLPVELARTGGVLLQGSPVQRLRQVVLLSPWSLRLRGWLRENGMAVLYANNRRAVLTAGPGARLAGVPVFWHIKQDVDRGRMDALALRLATHAAGCSRDVQRAFQTRHPRQAASIGYVPNGIPLASFAAPGADLRATLGIPKDAPVIGLAGSLTARKGVDLFVDAALTLAVRFPDLHFLLAGDAPQDGLAFKQQILAQAAPLLNAGRLHAPGYIDDMPAFYRTLDVLALPSRAEGFGLVVAEAGAAGVPCVRTATGGHTETTVEGVTGFVVPVDDLDALVDRLERLVAEPELRRAQGAAAREYALSQFDEGRFVPALTEALMRTAAGSRPAVSA